MLLSAGSESEGCSFYCFSGSLAGQNKVPSLEDNNAFPGLAQFSVMFILISTRLDTHKKSCKVVKSIFG